MPWVYQLAWGVGGLCVLAVWLGLARVVGSAIVLGPLTLATIVTVGVGLHTVIRGRSLPFFPRTRPGHGLLLAGGAVLVLIIAWQGVPHSREEHQHAEQQRIAEARSRAAQTARATTPALELLGWEWARPDADSTVLRGQVRNNSDQPFSLVFIEFNLYDRPGDQIGTASAMVRNLEPQGTWRFDARVFHGDALTAKIKALRGTR